MSRAEDKALATAARELEEMLVREMKEQPRATVRRVRADTLLAVLVSYRVWLEDELLESEKKEQASRG